MLSHSDKPHPYFKSAHARQRQVGVDPLPHLMQRVPVIQLWIMSKLPKFGSALDARKLQNYIM